MSFETLTSNNVAAGSQSAGFEMYLDPPIPVTELPTVWVDLHIGEGGWQRCEERDKWRAFQTAPDGRLSAIVRPGRGIRLTTHERVGTDLSHTAIVVNVASQASRGLIVAPGKVDPGFDPSPLGVVVFNQSRRAMRLHAGDKIAALAFVRVPSPAMATISRGYGSVRPAIPAVELRWWERATTWLARREWRDIGFEILKIVAAAIISLVALWVAVHLGWQP